MPFYSRPGRPVTLTVTGMGLACCLLAAGCGSARSGDAGATAPAPTVSASATGSAGSEPAGLPQVTNRVTKILVIMEENESIGQVFPSHMPYLWSLARRYGRATKW